MSELLVISMTTTFKVAVLGALFLAYGAPGHALHCVQTLWTFLSAGDKDGGASMVAEAAETDERALRTLLTLGVTATSLLRVMSPVLVLVACVHAALHLLSARRAGDGLETPAAPEIALLASFLLLLRYVVFPPASTLGSFQCHRATLAAFFTHHDKKFVPYMDHVGHERLLYARIRRLYRWCSTAAEAELTVSSS